MQTTAAYRIVLFKAIYSARGMSDFKALLFKCVTLPFCPYPGLTISVGLQPARVRAEELLWLPGDEYFRYDAEPEFLDERIAAGCTDLAELIKWEAADEWVVYTKEAAETYALDGPVTSTRTP